jgi:hypothetical protein
MYEPTPVPVDLCENEVSVGAVRCVDFQIRLKMNSQLIPSFNVIFSIDYC